MKINPRKDLKKIKPSFNNSTPGGVINDVIPHSCNDIIQEACDFHKVERRLIERTKDIDEDTIILCLRPPDARKLRYSRNEK